MNGLATHMSPDPPLVTARLDLRAETAMTDPPTTCRPAGSGSGRRRRHRARVRKRIHRPRAPAAPPLPPRTPVRFAFLSRDERRAAAAPIRGNAWTRQLARPHRLPDVWRYDSSVVQTWTARGTLQG